MPPDPGLLAVLRALAGRDRVNWERVESSHDDEASFLAVARELQVVDRIATFHRTLQESPDAAASSSWSSGPALDRRVESALDQPASWGPLTLLEHVGHGSFADVYRARDRRLERDVALKLLRERHAPVGDGDSAIREARLLAKVRHPNVVTVHGAEQIEGQVGIWTEFVHGSTLQHHIDTQGPMPAAEAMDVGGVLCGALAAVHEAGVVHGDVKAQNVLREPGGRLVLVDLGTGHERLQGVGSPGAPISGTPLYMAPELWRGQPPTPQSDIYGLGVLLYFLVSGAHPIRGATAAEVRDAHVAGHYTPLRDRGLRLPAAFTAAVDRALTADAAQRFQSTEAFAAALNVAPVAGTRRRSMAAAIAVLIIVSLAAAGYFGLFGARGAGSSAAREVTTRLEPPSAIMRGRPARNGRDFPYVDGQRNLMLWDRLANTSSVVMKHDDDPEVADWSLASPDGQQIVYRSGTDARGYELRIVNRDGSELRTVLARGVAPDFQPVDWSWNSRDILCWLDRAGGLRDLVLIPAAGGSPQVLQRVHTGLHAGASLSPDGSFVVYEALQEQTGTRRHLLIAATQPGAPRRVLTTTGTDDHSPHWTANGDLLFASVRDRQTSLHLMPMAKGVPRGPAALVADNLNLQASRGLSKSGILFFETLRRGADVFTAPIDLSREFSIGSPAPIEPAVPGGHSNGRWSPNGGHRFAYIDHAYNLLLIKDLVNGATTTIRHELARLGTEPPMWSPEERHVLVRGTGLDNREGFFRIAVPSGRTEPIVHFDGGYGQYEWLAGGRGIRYRHPRGVEERDLESGKASLVVSQNELGPAAGFGTSPDGRLLLVGIKDKMGVVLKLWDLRQRSTPPQIVARLGADSRFVAWAPDGKRVLYVHREKPEQSYQLWILPLDGGLARNLGALPGYTLVNHHVALHPEGHEFTYMQGRFGSLPYMLENFLR